MNNSLEGIKSYTILHLNDGTVLIKVVLFVWGLLYYTPCLLVCPLNESPKYENRSKDTPQTRAKLFLYAVYLNLNIIISTLDCNEGFRYEQRNDDYHDRHTHIYIYCPLNTMIRRFFPVEWWSNVSSDPTTRALVGDRPNCLRMPQLGRRKSGNVHVL